jgi:Proprotein convertase P-domain
MSLAKLSRLFPSSALCSLLVVPFAACSFGDDRRIQEPEQPDAAPEIDARPIDAGPGIDAMPVERVFEVMPNPPTTIPDNTTTGVMIPLAVTGVGYITGLNVEVNVTHPFRSDITILLLRGTNVISTLRPKGNTDSGDDIVATYPVAPSRLGTPYNGTYSVRFVDGAMDDIGTVNLVKLTFKVD